MRIEKIKLQNYRQYCDAEFNLTRSPENDLQIFIGKNGVGKTNLLNAINWCLYDNEPHLSAESNQQPILNKKTLAESEKDAIPVVAVEIHAATKDKKPVIFRREKSFSFSPDRKNLCMHNHKFQVFVKDNKNNDVIKEGEEATSLVKQFVPETIREYFFFDGERLENYFRNVTGAKIQQEMMDISKICYLQNMMDRLTKLTRDYTRDAGKLNPHVDKLRADWENENNHVTNLETEIRGLDSQIEAARRRLGEIEIELRGIPDVEPLEKERDELIGQIKQKSSLIEDKKTEKNTALYKHGILLMLQEPLHKTVEIIQDKKDKGELPPTDDRDLLLSTLENPTCKICGNQLDERSKDHIQKILQKISLSSSVAHELQRMEPLLDQYSDARSKYQVLLNKINDEIKNLDGELVKLNAKKTDADRKLESFNIEKVRKLQIERRNLDTARDMNLRRLGAAQTDLEKSQKQRDELQRNLDDAGIKDEKSKSLTQKSQFCHDAIKIITSSKNQLLDEIRQKIEIETNNNFFRLIWKKKTFKSVTIDSNYNVNLLSVDDIPMLGTVGKAENELLALAFMLALHNVSGFDSPILIDTPVARVSDEQRENFGKILAEISKEKQIILLFTIDEYSENIRKILNPLASNRFTIEMAQDERTTDIRGF